ncbi:MAG: hypothetical protein KF884_03460 [Fimbriimonadaceae bacterium]|nr:hypothetical protein [Fimbriimonadaceae bacterium]QYK59149.1 MAG: hypothetical protein KF884_03460 [Fimbriimonadaceae bacterium]
MPMKVRYTVVDGEVVSEVRSGVRRDYVTDSLGSTIALVDGAQNVTDTWEYWPYGEVRARTGTTPTPFQFVGTLGYYRDSSRRTYVRARHYRQDLGRWLTVDPLWPALGAYEYCLSAPSQGVDPSGFYESGGAEESGGPVLFPPDDLIFKYGRYCGKENWHNDCDDGVPRPKPLDCIDSACQAHDDCLKDAASKYGSAGYWTHDGKRCHCSLYGRRRRLHIWGLFGRQFTWLERCRAVLRCQCSCPRSLCSTLHSDWPTGRHLGLRRAKSTLGRRAKPWAGCSRHNGQCLVGGRQ